MISTEMLIVLLVFLVYIGAWYVYMDSFMDAVQKAFGRLRNGSDAQLAAHRISLLCISAGSDEIDFGRVVNTSGNSNSIIVNDVEAGVRCTVEGSASSSVITIEKEAGVIKIR